jgi:hypothetical protein
MASIAERLLDRLSTDMVGELVAQVTTAAELNEHGALLLKGDAAMIGGSLRTLAQTLSDPEDEAELYPSLAAAWLELRFEWQRYNLIANYQTVRDGSCPPLVLARASLVSGILAQVEELLEEEHRQQLMSSAVGLLDELRADVEQRLAA